MEFSALSLALPAMGHWSTCPPLNFQQFFSQLGLTLEMHKVWQRLSAVVSPKIFVFCDSSCGI